MPQLAGLGFGAGFILATPQPGVGNPAPNPTPLQVGVVQNMKFSISGDVKELHGANQYPVDTAIGKRSIKGSFEFAQITNDIMSQLFLADAVTIGSLPTIINEPHTAVASSLTATNGATFAVDYGVTYQATGVPLILITGGGTPAAGQYKVNSTTGVYTLSTADATAAVFISYSWTDAAVGSTLTAGNHQMGFGPIVALDCVFPYDAPTPGGMGFYFPNVRLGKIDVTTKPDDYSMFSTDFTAFAGPNGIPFISYNAF
jgi:hypothetical protein